MFHLLPHLSVPKSFSVEQFQSACAVEEQNSSGMAAPGHNETALVCLEGTSSLVTHTEDVI